MNNTYNLFVSGVHRNYFRGNSVGILINYVDSSNTINGNPVYYWVGKQHESVPSDAGYIMLVNCNNITIQNQNLRSNGEGIILLNTTNSRVFGNSVSDNIIGLGMFFSKQNMILENFIKNNDEGIRIGDAINNTITLNNITLNKVWAIDFKGSQTNNTIYCNNFIDNGNGNLQVSIDKLYGLGLGNFWDNGTIGNYWSDYLQRYPAIKIRDSSIWSVHFFINEVNIDRFPLTEPVDIETKPSITETLSTTQITIVIVLIAIVGAAFLVYFLKIKKTTKPK
jgi:parallel beta-helix repeat protein